MYVLGINAYHPDASVVLLKDGVPVWAAEEERFNRIKHSSGFPKEALRRCLKDCGVTPSEIDIVAISKNPRANLLKKILFVLQHRPSLKLVADRLRAHRKSSQFEQDFFDALRVPPLALKASFVNVEHHQAHIASSFMVSGFTESAFLSLDGMGDFSSAMWGFARRGAMQFYGRVHFPHSAGFFYTAATQFLGFVHFGDEYKVMGLAAYGQPVYTDSLRQMIRLLPDGSFRLNLDYFVHHKGQAKVNWQGGVPSQDIIFSKKWIELFGPSRKPDGELSQREKDLAASVQVVFEEIYFHVLNTLYEKTRTRNLCLAGGCALNSLANGKIKSRTPFKNVYIQAASNDSGTALGAAVFAYNQVSPVPSSYVMRSASLGNQASDREIEAALKAGGLPVERLEESDLLSRVARHIDQGHVVGWFQGKMELGPRALGNRSILADARRGDMKDILNQRIKLRESFRPFAPAVPVERAHEFFEMDCEDTPFMLKVFPVRKDKANLLPAVTHVDGTARVQTVSRESNLIFWKLLNVFGEKTGVPILINTSFNENEPIVCVPEDAIRCFLKTKMDVLVLGQYYVSRHENTAR